MGKTGTNDVSCIIWGQGSCSFSFFCILLNLTIFFCLLRFYLCLKRIQFGCDEKKWAQTMPDASFGPRVCFFFFFHVLLIFFGLFRLYLHYKETGKVGLAGDNNNGSKGMCFFYFILCFTYSY